MIDITFEVTLDTAPDNILMHMIDCMIPDRPLIDGMICVAIHRPQWAEMPPIDWQDRYSWVALTFEQILDVRMALTMAIQVELSRRIERENHASEQG